MSVYVLQMSSGEEIGLSRVLAPRRHDELLRQWRQYRGEMERGKAPAKLETVGPIDVEDQDDDGATVTVQVHWWNEHTNRDAGGWRVWAAHLPAWCGVHVRADACR
ncbi:hypothetical protein GA0074696_4062 [Micromonospora purpureochromogenes]|uniref:Uncharacterized protein n=1 Tax=Micromonospora purpureochromogenes TaxID=47872 RepID=A0A1C4Z5J6_9ACTN|nr:hypothetical protein [Micromonospora purpureochromogenes]SCF28289.1 hypothetical protein GA0074696_4062 [Micromonospora purpureochromogenes]